MNIRKETDYSDLYRALDKLMAKELAQMELYCGIGKAVCSRTEKGAAVFGSVLSSGSAFTQRDCLVFLKGWHA